MKILTISGSLRAGSFNTILLRAIGKLAPAGVEVQLAAPLDRVPHFNPDLDGESPPPGVKPWRDELNIVDGIMICSPEYAHGVPGVLKNALDWIVSSGELENKPLALINASSNYLGASIAHQSLRDILSTMGAVVIDDACLKIPGVRGRIDASGNVNDPDTKAALQQVLTVLIDQARAACEAS